MVVSEGPTITNLRDLVERASRQAPHLTTRLEKAAFLVVLRRIEIIQEDRYAVGAEDGLRRYLVFNGHCECHDYVRHGFGHWCKHRLALLLHSELYGDDTIALPGVPPWVIDGPQAAGVTTSER